MAAACSFSIDEPGPLDLVGQNASWRYDDTSGIAAAGWNLSSFDDTGWKEGRGPFGWACAETTSLFWGDCPGPDNCENGSVLSAYFRHGFDFPFGSAEETASVDVQRDDGIRVFLNGSLLFDDHVEPGGGAVFLEPGEPIDVHRDIENAPFVDGTNILAVELVQAGLGSQDACFGLRLTALPR